MTAETQTGLYVLVPQSIKRRSRDRPRHALLKHERLTICLGHQSFRRRHRALHPNQHVSDDVRLDAELAVGKQLHQHGAKEGIVG